MRHLCCSKIVVLFFMIVSIAFASGGQKSAIVYYGKDISYSNVGIHDYIIVEPENISPYTHGFKSYKKKIYAYVSIGEAEAYRRYFKEIKPEWKIAQNRAWGSTVMDISSDEYHEFLYAHAIEPLVQKGYENFFFDTLDSYQIAAETESQRKEYERGLIRFIKKFKLRYPHAKLIVNRGFEVMDQIHTSVDAVLFESLFQGLSPATLAYDSVKERERQWLLSQIKKVKAYGLELICVDYVDSKDEEKAEETAKKIEALGIIPYVSNKELTRYGLSSKEPVKREVLLLYNTDYARQHSNAHLMASLPLEYLGYVPVLKDLKEGLPDRDELSRYKGVLIWLEAEVKDSMAFEKWINVLVQRKQKVLFLGGFGVSDDKRVCDSLGIEKVQNAAGVLDKQSMLYRDRIIGFESDPSFGYSDNLYQPQSARKLLRLLNSSSQESVPAAITTWGGYVLSDYVTKAFGKENLWIVNPFELFKEALSLESIPVPDPTTQNGRRLLFSHIDGDASMNRAEWDAKQYSIGVTYEKILKRYTIPQSVSIVEAETSPKGLYPEDSASLEEMAKKIYALDYVEAATHTFSHPFEWTKIKEGDLDEAYRLKVKDYDFSIEREIEGSLEYINTHLLPQGKKKAQSVYWTGDCSPEKEILEHVYKNDLLNINGGQTVIVNDKPWLSLVAPYGIRKGEYYQIYTGAENENEYTNHFTGPFWGYKKVVQTFKLTDKPRRLKPIDIYYHFYAASKTASLKALQDVFEWALAQETMPIYTSEYIPKVMEFYDLSMSKNAEVWHFEGMKELKTLRLDESMGEVVLNGSLAVTGQRREGSVRYVHLNTLSPSIDLELGAKGIENENYLVDTNAEILNYRANGEEVSFRLRSHVQISLNYHLKKGCTLTSEPKALKELKKGGVSSLEFNVKEADVLVRCR